MTELLAEAPDAHLSEAPKVSGLSLSVAEPDAILVLGGEAKDKTFSKAIKSALRVDLPDPGGQSGRQRVLIWQGFGRWLLYCHSSGAAALAGLQKSMGPEAAVSDVSDAFFAVEIEGPLLRDLLAMGCSVDCSAGVMPSGSSAVLRFAELPATLIVTGRESAIILVERASKGYVWAWLSRATGLLA